MEERVRIAVMTGLLKYQHLNFLLDVTCDAIMDELRPILNDYALTDTDIDIDDGC